MGKIKEGEITLNVVQVCEKLENTMTYSQKEMFGKAAWAMVGDCTLDEIAADAKQIVAHTILDNYRLVVGVDEQTIEIRRCLKYVMERYMKSTSVVHGEEDAFINLITSWAVDGGKKRDLQD